MAVMLLAVAACERLPAAPDTPPEHPAPTAILAPSAPTADAGTAATEPALVPVPGAPEFSGITG